jgi:uncharacterized protein
MSTTASAPAALRPTVAVWFEIPAADYERAIRFYETLFAKPLNRVSHDPQTMAVFPYERPGVSGCIVPAQSAGGGASGPIVFLNADGRLDEMLEEVYEAGGRIVTPRTEIGAGMGWFAHIIDSEGNRIGLHAIS